MTYIATTIFPIVAIISGIASLFSLAGFVREIYTDIHRADSER